MNKIISCVLVIGLVLNHERHGSSLLRC